MSSSKQTFNLKGTKLPFSYTQALSLVSEQSPNMQIYNWVLPTKFTGARMTALKKRETFYIS